VAPQRGSLVQTAVADAAGWRANNCGNTFVKDGAPTLTFADEEDRILRRLGEAVIMCWNTIPTKLRRELFDNASSVGELLEAGALKGQIARFLHKHKDGAGETARAPMRRLLNMRGRDERVAPQNELSRSIRVQASGQGAGPV
jgi:hypothetical protein